MLEFKCSDFDGALFHVWSGHQNADELNISLSYGGAAECLKQGGKARLQKIYGPHLVAPENGFDVSLRYSFNEIAGNRGPSLPLASSMSPSCVVCYYFTFHCAEKREVCSTPLVVPPPPQLSALSPPAVPSSPPITLLFFRVSISSYLLGIRNRVLIQRSW